MARLLLLALVFVAAQLSGCAAQQATTCTTCAGALTSRSSSINPCSISSYSGPPTGSCTWCTVQDVLGSASYCYATSDISSSVRAQYGSRLACFSSPATCPPPIPASSAAEPRAQTAALIGVGCLAVLALGALLYVPGCEKLQGAAAPAAAGAPPRAALHALFAAASCLWVAGAALLAAPTVPWLYYSPSTGTSTYTVTLFALQQCLSNGASLSCQTSIPFSDPVIKTLLLEGGVVGATYIPFVAAAQSIGTCCYVFALVLLLPAALVTSTAVYKLKNFLLHSLPTHTHGCAPGNLFVALLLALLGALATLGTAGAALSTGAAVVAAQASPLTAIVPPLAPTAGSGISAAGMPGPALGGIALALAPLAAALLLYAYSCVPGLRALPGFGAPCACSGSAAAAPPQRLVSNPAAFAAAAPKAPAPAPPPLPPGWARAGPDEEGQHWYIDPAGGAHWTLPGQ